MNPNISNNNCPTCCANRREDRRIVDEGDDVDTYCDDPWHATPTPAAPADDAECYCGRYAREHSIGDGCGNFTPRPADDASGAEAIAPVWRVELWAEQIRVAWVDWALTQPNPKPSWLVPWATLDEQSKDADRAIARRLLALYAAPLPARDDAVEDAASVERAASKWIASEVDAYPGTTMDDRIASWMRGGVHPDDVSRFLVDAYVAGHRAALRREKESRSDDSRPASGQGCA